MFNIPSPPPTPTLKYQSCCVPSTIACSAPVWKSRFVPDQGLLRVVLARGKDTPHASESRTVTLDAVRANPTLQTHYSVTHPPWGRLAPDQDCCCEAAYRQGREVVTLKHPVYSLQNLRRRCLRLRFLPAGECFHFDVHRLGHFGEAKTPFGGC